MMNTIFGRDLSLLLKAIVTTFCMVIPSKAAKQLVLIAGARQEGIQEFFYQFATGLKMKTSKSDSLLGWRWPIIRDENLDLLLRESATGVNISGSNIFDLFFRRKTDSVTQEFLMEAMRDSWKNSTRGIIVGDERFDKVGVAPFTSDDALEIIYRLIENLGVGSKDVTVILLYHTPRVEQWVSILQQQSTYKQYTDYLCGSDETDKRFEYLDTTMNPFKIAKVYRQHGWNVVIVDEDGVRRSGFDPAHVIACDVLGVRCNEGWIIGLKEEISRAPPLFEIYGLSEDDKLELEQLFLTRDCCYKQDLELDSEAKKFQIISKNSVWKNCRNRYTFEFKKKIGDVNFFMNAVQSQQGCAREIVDLSDVVASSDMAAFEKLLWTIVLPFIFFLATVSGILYSHTRNKRGKNKRNQSDGIFRNIKIREGKSINSTTLYASNRQKPLCNACKFVRFDRHCIFCSNGRSLKSSEIGKEVERRIKRHQIVDVVNADEIKNGMEVDPQVPIIPASFWQESSEVTFEYATPTLINDVSSNNKDLHYMRSPKTATRKDLPGADCVDTARFDINLRNSRSQSKKRGGEEKQKSKVVRKLKELLVLKTEKGDKTYSVKEPPVLSSKNNLQAISLDEDGDNYL